MGNMARLGGQLVKGTALRVFWSDCRTIAGMKLMSTAGGERGAESLKI